VVADHLKRLSDKKTKLSLRTYTNDDFYKQISMDKHELLSESDEGDCSVSLQSNLTDPVKAESSDAKAKVLTKRLPSGNINDGEYKFLKRTRTSDRQDGVLQTGGKAEVICAVAP